MIYNRETTHRDMTAKWERVFLAILTVLLLLGLLTPEASAVVSDYWPEDSWPQWRR